TRLLATWRCQAPDCKPGWRYANGLEGDHVTSTSAAQWRELARRAGEGIEIALLWNGSLNCFKVTVSDRRLCRYLDLEVAGAESFPSFHEHFANAASPLPVTALQAYLSERLSKANEQGGQDV